MCFLLPVCQEGSQCCMGMQLFMEMFLARSQCPNVYRVLALVLFARKFVALDENTVFAQRGLSSTESAQNLKVEGNIVKVTLLWFRLSLT